MKKFPVAQQEAQKQLHVFADVRKKKYQDKPKAERQGKSKTEKLQIIEENDYAGVRSRPPEERVTEKSKNSANKKEQT